MKISALKIILVAIVALPVSAYAEGGNDIQKHKEIKLQGIDGRISILQQERACVQAADNKGGVRACESASHQAMEQIMEKQKASWESMKEGKK